MLPAALSEPRVARGALTRAPALVVGAAWAALVVLAARGGRSAGMPMGAHPASVWDTAAAIVGVPGPGALALVLLAAAGWQLTPLKQKLLRRHRGHHPRGRRPPAVAVESPRAPPFVQEN